MKSYENIFYIILLPSFINYSISFLSNFMRFFNLLYSFFLILFIRQSPAPALRALANLANAYQPLARELFSAAFVCCWSELNEKYRKSLVEALETAFTAIDVSPEILQTLLNLAEFMEHDSVEGGLPIETRVLAELALKCRSYAKALHYKEKEHNSGNSSSECVGYLILINSKLDLPGTCILL